MTAQKCVKVVNKIMFVYIILYLTFFYNSLFQYWQTVCKVCEHVDEWHNIPTGWEFGLLEENTWGPRWNGRHGRVEQKVTRKFQFTSLVKGNSMLMVTRCYRQLVMGNSVLRVT